MGLSLNWCRRFESRALPKYGRALAAFVLTLFAVILLVILPYMIFTISGEPYQAHQFFEALRAEKREQGFELYALDAQDLGEAFSRTLADLLCGQTLFKKPKFIGVRVADAKVAYDFLDAHALRVGENVLVFYAPGERVFTYKSSGIEIKHFTLPTGQNIKSFVARELGARGGRPSPLFIASLISSLPRTLSTLYPVIQEIEKYTLAGEHYAELEIRQSFSNPFALTEALSRKDIPASLVAIEKQIQEGQQALDIMNRVIWQLRVLLLVSDAKFKIQNYLCILS